MGMLLWVDLVSGRVNERSECVAHESMERRVYSSGCGGNGQRGGGRYELSANNQGIVLPNTVELDAGWQVSKRNLEID